MERDEKRVNWIIQKLIDKKYPVNTAWHEIQRLTSEEWFQITLEKLANRFSRYYGLKNLMNLGFFYGRIDSSAFIAARKKEILWQDYDLVSDYFYTLITKFLDHLDRRLYEKLK